ncbi:hypothetical protein VU08_08655, partial [Desulfobulbus sp. F5]|nr:hypothetical protein [Desulfobulbus sp. F5]
YFQLLIRIPNRFGEKIKLHVNTERACYMRIISIEMKEKYKNFIPIFYRKNAVDFFNSNFEPITESPPRRGKFYISLENGIAMNSLESISATRGMIRTEAKTSAEGIIDMVKLMELDNRSNTLTKVVYTYK